MSTTRHAVYLCRNIERRSRNHCCCREAISITYFECLSVAVFIQPVKRLHPTVLPSLACPAVTNGTIFLKKRATECKMCVLIFSTTIV